MENKNSNLQLKLPIYKFNENNSNRSFNPKLIKLNKYFSHAHWCPACRSLTKQWQTLASSSSQMGIQVAKIDVTENPSLSGRFFVTALPTIFHVINGEFRQYRGPRDSQTLEEFVLEKKWKNLETVPWYFYPDSYFMGAASYFFKLSHGLKVKSGRIVKCACRLV